MAIEPGEIVARVRGRNAPGLVSAYDKVRIRRSIEYPVAGCAVAVARDGDTIADLRVAFTGTNPRPVRIEGTEELIGGALDDAALAKLDDLCRDQLMSMKTTYTPGTYRRRRRDGDGQAAGGAVVRGGLDCLFLALSIVTL